MKTGRPTNYKKEYAALLTAHMSGGLSFVSFGGVVHCCKQTLFTWLDKHPDFKEAKSLGETASQLYWEKVGVEGLYMGGKENPFNATVWIFNMKNRFGWRDKQPDEEEQQGGQRLPPAVPMTPETLVKLVQAAREGKK